MKKEYEKAFKLMQEIVDNIEYENQVVINKLRYLKYFINKWGYTLPNGKQEFSCYKILDVLNDIIDGKIDYKEESE